MNKKWIAFILLFAALLGCKKDPVFYTIIASVSKGGTINPMNNINVESGKSIVFTITPDANYVVSSIKVDGVDVPVANTVEIKNVDSNKEIRVVFALATFTVTASATSGGTIEPSGITNVEVGKSQIYKIIPDVDFGISSIKVDGVAQPISDTYEFKNVASNRTINVEFVATPWLTINKSEFKDHLSFGEKTNFSWSVINVPVTSITLNGIPVEKVGSKFTGSLFENTEYLLKVVGPGGEKVEKLSIIVGDWTTSVLGLLTNKPWKLKEENVLNSKKERIDNLILSRNEIIILTKDHKYSFYWDGENVSSGDFSLTDNTLTFYDAPVEITKIDKDIFVYIQKSSNNDNYVEYIYVPEP
jgi:hypothetical protein